MRLLTKYVTAIVSATCTIAIARGILLWLAGKDIYPDRWVNEMIGLAEGAVTANPAGTWVLLGLAGLLGLAIGPSIFDWGINKFGGMTAAPEEFTGIRITDIRDTTPENNSHPLIDPWPELHSAALWAIYQSAWGKWQREQYGSRGSEEHFIDVRMHMVATIVMDAAISGSLEIKGRPPDAIEFEPISGATWRLAALSVVPDNASIHKFEVIPRSTIVGTDVEPDPSHDRIKDVLSYDSLIVNFEQFQSVFNALGPDNGNG